MASYAQALAALLVSVSPNHESLAICPLGYEYTDESGVPRTIYLFKHLLEQTCSDDQPTRHL
jgi:hypothetical protein